MQSHGLGPRSASLLGLGCAATAVHLFFAARPGNAERAVAAPCPKFDLDQIRRIQIELSLR